MAICIICTNINHYSSYILTLSLTTITFYTVGKEIRWGIAVWIPQISHVGNTHHMCEC
jgi:hypothetical protein